MYMHAIHRDRNQDGQIALTPWAGQKLEAFLPPEKEGKRARTPGSDELPSVFDELQKKVLGWPDRVRQRGAPQPVLRRLRFHLAHLSDAWGGTGGTRVRC